MLKHYNKEEIKTMPKTLEEAETMSNKNNKQTVTDIPTKQTHEGQITRSRAKEINNQKEIKDLYSFRFDQYGLPRITQGIKQPVWVHTRGKFLQSLTF